jgi:hypothetical protein
MFVAGFTYGTSHPKMKPESAPHKGPSKGAVMDENMMPDNVITAGVPRIGYVGMIASASIRAVQTPTNATNSELVTYFRLILNHPMSYLTLVCNFLHSLIKLSTLMTCSNGNQAEGQ